jgi:hypothetical protein
VTLLAPILFLKAENIGGPATEPTFPSSPVPRAKITVTSVQQVEFRTPFSVEPPPEPCGVQELWGGELGVEEVRVDGVEELDWTLIRDERVVGVVDEEVVRAMTETLVALMVGDTAVLLGARVSTADVVVVVA